jgi:hypothetical protein
VREAAIGTREPSEVPAQNHLLSDPILYIPRPATALSGLLPNQLSKAILVDYNIRKSRLETTAQHANVAPSHLKALYT